MMDTRLSNSPPPEITPRVDIQDPPGGVPLVMTSPYNLPVNLGDAMGPAIEDYLNVNLPVILPPYIQPAADAAVAATALLRAGDTATGPILTTQVLPVANNEFATKLYVDTVGGGGPGGGIGEAPADGQVYGRDGQAMDWVPVLTATSIIDGGSF